MFGLTTDCGGTEAIMMNRTLNVLKERCGTNTLTEFTGIADCSILRYIAMSIMQECGPICGPNEYARVNVDENAVFCACDGNCLKDFRDNTLNSLIGIIVGLLIFQILFNSVRMFDSVYGLGLFSRSSEYVPVVGKTV